MASAGWPSALRQRTASSVALYRDRIGAEEVHIPPVVTVVEAQEVSLRTERSREGRCAEPQITVLIFPDCSALEVNVVSLTLFSSNSLSDPSPLADGQFGDTLQACQDLAVLPWCCNYSLKERGQTQSSGTWVCFPTDSTRKRCSAVLSEILC